MALTAKEKNAQPSAWIVNPNDKGRKSIKNGKVFLEDRSTFEIELFNPLTECVLAEIKLNGQSISKTGLVLKPGQRYYLDCFIDDKKKFIFNTYEIENSDDSKKAIEKNGLLEVFFYKENVITINNWKNKFDKIIIERWYPYYRPYNNYPWYNPYYYGLDGTYYGSNLNNIGISNNSYSNNTELFKSSSTYTTNISGNFGSSTINNEGILRKSSNIETGRIEKGEKSKQEFTEIDMDFESNYISSTIIQILPESRKPIDLSTIKNTIKKDSDEIINLIKKLGELHSAGILTDDEFSTKKAELLSKI